MTPDRPLMSHGAPSTLPVGARVAIIMDGNGRWAERHGVSVTEGHRAGAEALDAESEAGQRFGMRGEALGVLLRQVDDLGDEQHLRRHRPRVHRLLQRLVDEALVGGVLVDDD